MTSVFLVWLTEGNMVPVTEIRSLGGEENDMFCFEHVVFEMLLRHLRVIVE